MANPPPFRHKSGNYTTHSPQSAALREGFPRETEAVTGFEVFTAANVMAERLVQGNFMRSDKVTTAAPQPQTRNELQAWVHDRLALSQGSKRR